MLKLLGSLHGRFVHQRRVRVLADLLASWLPAHGRVIDVGCGDGAVAAALLARRPDVQVEGFDVLARAHATIPVHPFDGRRIPLPDRSVDAVLLVDVLHHCELPEDLLREAARVAARAVLIKDHRIGYPAAAILLRFMDWIGNRPHGVVLPYNYWREDRWRRAWRDAGLEPSAYRDRLGLYPFPFSVAFDTGLHFAAALEPRTASTPPPPAISRWERAYEAFETPEQELQKFLRRLRSVGAHQWDRRARVLEVCSGRGSGLRAWRTLGFTDVVGVDLSPTLVASQRGQGRAIVGDARELPLPTSSRDIVVVQGGLHHLATGADVDRALREMRRVVTPDGRIVIVEPWPTLFLHAVHAACNRPLLRRLWPKLDALATMIDEERETYNRWFRSPDEFLTILRRHVRPQILRRRLGKLIVVGVPTGG